MRQWLDRHRLRLGVGAALTGGLVLLGALAAYQYGSGRRQAAIEAELQRGSGLALALAEAALPEVLAGNLEGAARTTRALSRNPGVFLARVLTTDGAVIAEATRDTMASALAFGADRAQAAGPELGLSLRYGLGALSRARLERLDFDGEPLAVHYYPLLSERAGASDASPARIVGWAQLAVSLRGLDRVQEEVLWVGAAWLGGAIALGLALSALLGRSVFAPIAALRAAVEEAADEVEGIAPRRPAESDAAFAERVLARALAAAREARAEAGALRASLDAAVERRTHEYEALADRALASSRVKSEFLANMSHELRTPLNSIIGFGEVLEAEAVGELNAKQKKYVGNILGSGRHLLELINDILDLSKIEAGRMSLEPSLVRLSDMIQGSLAVIAPRAREKSIVVTTEVAEGLESVSADGRKIKQALYNLLSNAVKFTPQGGRISVRATCTGADVRIAVSDTGIGVAPADRERIFQAFEQVDGSSTRRYEGTGLGLALTLRFMEMHDGTVELESEPGVGSTFTLVFPFVPGEESALLGTESWEAAATAAPAPKAPRFAVIGLRERDRLTAAVRSAGGAPEPFETVEELAARMQTGDFAPVAAVAEVREIARGGWAVVDRLLAAPLGEVAIIAVCASEEDAALAEANRESPRVAATHAARLPEALAGLVRAGTERRTSGRVLVVDSEPEWLALTARALAEDGFEVLTADAALRGLLLAGEAAPDLVILEVALGGMDGFEFLQRLRRQPSNAAVSVVAYTSKDLTLQERRRLAGQIDFLAFKGQTTETHLLHEVRAILGRRGLRPRAAA